MHTAAAAPAGTAPVIKADADTDTTHRCARSTITKTPDRARQPLSPHLAQLCSPGRSQGRHVLVDQVLAPRGPSREATLPHSFVCVTETQSHRGRGQGDGASDTAGAPWGWSRHRADVHSQHTHK